MTLRPQTGTLVWVTSWEDPRPNTTEAARRRRAVFDHEDDALAFETFLRGRDYMHDGKPFARRVGPVITCAAVIDDMLDTAREPIDSPERAHGVQPTRHAYHAPYTPPVGGDAA